MEDIIEKAQFCLNCKVKPCKKGCPMETTYQALYNV